MNLVKKVLQKFNGLHYRQEYLCVARESFTPNLYVYLVDNKQVIKDITNQHLFVGYCPLVFAFADMALPGNIQLIFTAAVLQPNDTFSKKDAIALLNLKKIKEQAAGNNCILYYEGTAGKHFFQSSFHQFISDLNNRWFNKKQGNVFLHSNLFKQVQIAYAIPRIIALITIRDAAGYNLFPTDLHGQADSSHYIISLRTGGKACAQVEAAGKLVLTQVDCRAYKTVYALGKNHMQPLRPKDQFPFGELSSATLQWPIPQPAFSYKELTLLEAFTHGIHKILLFTIVTEQQLTASTGTLAHINNSYASWRYKNKQPGNYLLR